MKVAVGPMDFNLAKGTVDVSPKWTYGVSGNSFEMTAGLGDLREGIHFGYGASVKSVFTVSGSSLQELLNNAQNKGAGGMGHHTFRLHLISAAMQATGIDIKLLKMEGILAVSDGVGEGYGVALGWANKDGFHMIGFHGKVCGKHGCITVKYFVGKHKTARKLRYILAVPNVELDVVVWLP